MLFGLDLFTLGIAFLIFVPLLAILGKLVWHTFHGDIKSLFLIAIIISFIVGIILIATDRIII